MPCKTLRHQQIPPASTAARLRRSISSRPKAKGSYLGAIGGGVVGALLGSQVGGGGGRTAAQIAGAVGGAYAGHAIEGKVRKSTHYEVVVRLQNGATQTIVVATDPGLWVGDPVKIVYGALVRNP